MPFDFISLNRRYLAEYPPPVTPAPGYGVTLTRNPAAGLVFRCIGIHHLWPDENNGNHNIFLEVLDQDGHRIQRAEIAWSWEGMRADEQPRPAVVDKPANEPGTNISLVWPQTVTVAVRSLVYPSDSVGNLHIRHADEAPGNTLGHHSFYVVFQLRLDGSLPPPPVGDKVVWTPVFDEDGRLDGAIGFMIGADKQIKAMRYNDGRWTNLGTTFT